MFDSLEKKMTEALTNLDELIRPKSLKEENISKIQNY